MSTNSFLEKLGWPGYLRSSFARTGWIVIVPWMTVGVTLILDTSLTYYGLQRGLTEMNPIATLAIDTYGYESLFVLKVLAVLFAWRSMRLLPETEQILVPLALALPWTSAVIVNIHRLI